jgi:RNA polymerase sigma factor (sigma-70 family)
MTAHTDPLLRHIRRLVLRPSASPESDAVLLGRFLRHKDDDAFAALVARHGPMVLGVCRRVLRNPHEAEDAAQASFVVLARKAAGIRRPEMLAAWLHRTAHQLALAALRADKRRLERETRSYSPHDQADPLDEISVRELLVILDEEVQRLPERYRLPVILCCLEERTVEAAARQLGWSSGSLRGRLMRGRTLLHARLIRRGVTLSAALLVLGGSPAMSAAGLTTRFTEGRIAPNSLALAQKAMQGMAAAKMRRVFSLFLLLGAVGVGAGALAHQGRAGKHPQENLVAGQTQDARPTKPPGAGRPAPRTDQFGDPPPEGVVSRLGTIRWRHGGLTTAVQFTPDGKSLLTMGVDGLRVWDVASGRSRHRLENREGRYLNPGILSADGKQVVTVDLNRKENRLGLWDVVRGKLLREFGDHPCIAGTFSPDGKVLATMGAVQPGVPRFRDFADVITLWDLTTGQRLHSWKGHPGGVYCGAFTADGKTLLTGGADKVIRFWDVASGRPVRQLHGSARPIGHIALSADGRRMATIGLRGDSAAGVLFPSALAWYADNDLALWEVAAGKEVHRFAFPTSKYPGRTGFRMAAFHPDGKTLLAAGTEPSAYRWDLATGKEVRRYDLDSIGDWSAALSPDGQTLAVLDRCSVRLFDLTSGRERFPTGVHRAPVWRTALTPDGQTAITAAAGESDIVVWDTATGRERYRLPHKGRWSTHLLLADDGRTLYALDDQGGNAPRGGIVVWDLGTRKPIRHFPPHPVFKGANLRNALAPDGKTLALAEAFGRVVYLLDTASGKEIRQLQAPEAGVSYLAFGPDGRTLVVVCSDGSVQTWNLAGGIRQAELPAWGSAMARNGVVAAGREAVALSPDGKWLARVEPEGSPALMELATGQLAPLPETRAKGVYLFAFSPDSRTLAWNGWLDSTIHLLEVASGQERGKLVGHLGQVESLAFAGDGRLLISGSKDSTALIWDLTGHHATTAADGNLDSCWADLASGQADRAYQAMQKLMRRPNQAVRELSKHLRPVAGVDAAEVARLIADLDSEQFPVRQRATEAVSRLGERAEPSLREALKGKPSPEVRKRVEALLGDIKAGARMPESLRYVRAVEVLEQIGSRDAQDVLKTLAGGMPTARLTREATAARERLAKRTTIKP